MAPWPPVIAFRVSRRRAAHARDVTGPASDARAAPGRVRVFGEDLATDLPLPGLPVVAPDDGQFPYWALVTEAPHGDATQHSPSARIVGTLPYGNDVAVTLAAGATGSEIVFSDTGRFTVNPTTRVITHRAPGAVDRSAVALDLIGVVLPYALHQRGAWCVHASAVQTQDGVIAFIAPRGSGKSTLAAACVQRGCALVADDVVVLRPTLAEGVQVVPAGLPLRLRAEAARAMGATDAQHDGWGKVRVHGAVAGTVSRLSACYVLTPVTAETAVSRELRSTRAAAIALLANGKLTALLGAGSTGDALSRCIELAQQIPVYDLAVPRALAHLPAVTTQLLHWHQGIPVDTRRPA
jgi:hypothetical protein